MFAALFPGVESWDWRRREQIMAKALKSMG
jgi:hypothetical protein